MTMTEQETTMIVDLSGSDAQAFGRIIGNISKTVSTSRPGVLEGVQIRQDGETLIFQTTDTYRAVTVTLPLGTYAIGNVREPVILSGKQLVKAAKLVTRKTEHVSMTLAGNYVTITTGHGSANVETYVGTWPNMDKILDAAKQDGFPSDANDGGAGVDALLLADTLTAVGKMLGTDQPRVELRGMGVRDVSTSRGPWYWSADNYTMSIDVVIMPLRK